ncbi:hypothetical protein NEOLEDRAFT_1145610 [Neolentinus lepideus HHB14362 ss-1]|uniref:Uncharacterized protein n=1 Tax=Neolentinus lepideus HHB14362 ss-1 TaxID=1314782 RepID=A0A165UXI8_9AGAM|nr:hypothetical protein NEOLEDRAFT_1145610 [Neolentinus lepideus HHB14362 ss-1]
MYLVVRRTSTCFAFDDFARWRVLWKGQIASVACTELAMEVGPTPSASQSAYHDFPMLSLYTRRDYWCAAFYLQWDMGAYVSIDTAAIEELPAYSAHDAGSGRRYPSHEHPYVEAFQEAGLARHDDHAHDCAGLNSNASGESSRESGRQGFTRFVASLLRSTVRFCSLVDLMSRAVY